jgi:hypothetical protein
MLDDWGSRKKEKSKYVAAAHIYLLTVQGIRPRRKDYALGVRFCHLEIKKMSHQSLYLASVASMRFHALDVLEQVRIFMVKTVSCPLSQGENKRVTTDLSCCRKILDVISERLLRRLVLDGCSGGLLAR